MPLGWGFHTFNPLNPQIQLTKLMNAKAALYKKILAVQKVLDPLEKSGHNDFPRYNYATAGDVLLPVQRACNEHFLIVIADCIDAKIEPGRASVTVKLTVADSESGESISISAPGYAEDWSWKDNKPTGDKAIYKAITGATKYAIRSFFCLPSEDDPERTDHKSAASATKPAFSVSKPNTALIDQTTAELKRLGWSTEQGRTYLQQTFGKSTRQSLTEQELQKFLNHLRSLQSALQPMPELRGNQ